MEDGSVPGVLVREAATEQGGGVAARAGAAYCAGCGVLVVASVAQGSGPARDGSERCAAKVSHV
ncbi:hypothetical protein [Streptomyces glaucescens]|uniref:hypothetical protein n=1 Tax=Streptomyces glaucescens TaxID=1907 RepID=UPI0005BD4B28|nr:hypothetical protein [Streptomyces glaucescens]